jgi:hypothetical protein
MSMRATSAVLAASCTCIALAQEPRLTSVYVDLPAAQCQASDRLMVKIDDAPVPIARATPGPHPVSAVLLFDTSPSMLVQPLEAIARRLSLTVQPPDRFVLGTFSPKVLFSKTVLNSQDAASRAAREVGQKQVGQGGPSPLWDALYESASMQASTGIRAVVVFTDARSSGNDRGYADAYDQFVRAGAAVIVVGVGDDALPRNSNMYVIGRNDALRKLADDTAGFYTELIGAKSPPPYEYLVEGLRNLRHRCRLEVDLHSTGNAPLRLSLTSAGVVVRAPVRMPAR